MGAVFHLRHPREWHCGILHSNGVVTQGDSSVDGVHCGWGACIAYVKVGFVACVNLGGFWDDGV